MNKTLVGQESRAQNKLRAFEKYIELTQPPDFDYTECDPEDLNMLLIGYFGGTSCNPPHTRWLGIVLLLFLTTYVNSLTYWPNVYAQVRITEILYQKAQLRELLEY